MINNFESNVQYIKYLVNKEVAKRFFIGNLDNSIDSVREIAEEIIPGPKALFRCCIYKEKEIIRQRTRMALGKPPVPVENDNKRQIVRGSEAA